MRTNGTTTHLIAGLMIIAGTAPRDAHADTWPQWGGPDRNFTVKSDKLADTWPEDGPPRLWHRPLGDGYASLVGDGDLVFTMYRPEHTAEHEFVVAINARTGKTAWENRYPSELPQPVSEFGHGPNSTPVLVGDRLYAIGTNAVVRCLDQATGKLHWTRDLRTDFNSPLIDGWGYTTSPLAYKDTLIIPLGHVRPKNLAEASNDGPPVPAGDDADAGDGRDRSVIALRLADGKLVWKSDEYVVHQSSPMLINHGGQDQLIVLTLDAIAAIDPSSGRQLWRLGFEESGLHSVTPMWDGGDLLWFASDAGGQAIRLARENGRTVPHKAWSNRKMAAGFYQGVQIDNGIYVPGSSRFYAYDRRTGERLWNESGFESASCILADGKLFILDQNGQLTLATPSMEKLTIHAQCQVAERLSITSPILVGRTLFIRDRKNIMAFDVGVVKK